MASTAPRTRLEQLARAAHLTNREFLVRFQEAAGELDVKAHVSERQAKRWLAGASEAPRAESRRVLEHWWGESVDRLLGPPEAVMSAVVPEEEYVTDAGRQSVEHAIQAASALDPSALEHLHAAAQNMAHAYYVAQPLTLFTDLIRLRDTLYDQLDRTHKPRQQAQLYLLAGQVCGLLSTVSWDLGHAAVAAEQARAAYTYGNVIDHPSLCAYARSLQVTVEFWSGLPRRAARLAADAIQVAPSGTARARLHAVHARSLALIGARDEVAIELRLAAQELDHAGDDPFLDDIGGELSFDRSRRALSAGAAYVALGDGEQAETEAAAALELFGEMPRHMRWGAGELSARVDMATARALRGDLAGTEEALTSVFELDMDRRTEALCRRLTGLGRLVGTSRYRGAIEARRIGDAVENFTVHSLPRTVAQRAITAGG